MLAGGPYRGFRFSDRSSGLAGIPCREIARVSIQARSSCNVIRSRPVATSQTLSTPGSLGAADTPPAETSVLPSGAVSQERNTVMNNGSLLAVRCAISRGGFSSERVFRMRLANGAELTGDGTTGRGGSVGGPVVADLAGIEHAVAASACGGCPESPLQNVAVRAR